MKKPNLLRCALRFLVRRTSYVRLSAKQLGGPVQADPPTLCGGRGRLRAPRILGFLISPLLVAFIFLAGCGSSGDGGKAALPQETAPEPQAVQSVPAGSGTLVGEVTFSGAPPAPVPSPVKSFSECAIHHPGDVWSDDIVIHDGKIQNVFIYVKKGLEGKVFPVTGESPTLDQVGCFYKPHVSGIQVGQELVIKNSDVSLHNVHTLSASNPSFNLGMPVQGMKVKKKFAAPEIMVKFVCDVHPWMRAYLGVLPHPFFAVSGQDGRFEIGNLPAGTYTIEAWHEKFGAQTQDITLDPNQTQTLNFTFSAP